MKIANRENHRHQHSIANLESTLLSSEAKLHQGLAPLPYSPGVETRDSETPIATLTKIRQGIRETETENNFLFQKTEDCSLHSQTLANTLCPSTSMLKSSGLQGSDGRTSSSKPASTHSLRVLRMTRIHPSAAVGPEIPYSPTTARPHGHSTGPPGTSLLGYDPLSHTWFANIFAIFDNG